MQRALQGDWLRGTNEVLDRTNLEPGVCTPAAAEAQRWRDRKGVLARQDMRAPATMCEGLRRPACRASDGYVETSQLLGTGSEQGLP
jgi:hypothetical protein